MSSDLSRPGEEVAVVSPDRAGLPCRCHPAILRGPAAGFAAWMALAICPPAFAQIPRWVQLPPPPLSGAPAVFDSLRGRLLAVGGPLDAHGHSTIWSLELPGDTWKELEFGGDVPAIQPHGMVLDPAGDRLLVYSGPTPTPTPAGVYALDLSDALPTWTLLTTTGAPPTTRSDYSVVLDPVRYRLLVFGGYLGGALPPTYGNKVWALSLEGTPEWTELAPSGQLPIGRGGHTAVYDATHDRMVVYGGFHPNPPPTGSTLNLDETWALSLSGTPTWQFLTPAGSVPTARRGHAASVSRNGPAMVIFGGLSGTGTFRNDTWVLDLAASTTSAYWTQQPAGSAPDPAPRWGASACWDTPRGRMLIHGGTQQQGQQAVPSADTWALVPGAPEPWTAFGPAVLAPPAIRSHASVLDAADERLYLIGGLDDYGNPNDDTWSRPLDVVQGWVRAAASGPGLRAHAGAWADPADHRALLYGGQGAGGAPLPDQVMSLDFATDTWSTLAAAPVPPARTSPFTAFDEVRRRFLVYGGAYATLTGNVHLEDTWVFDAGTGAWEDLSATAGSFGRRHSGAEIWDPVRDRMIVYGGVDSTTSYNDVHVLPLGAGGAWAPMATSGVPPPLKLDVTAAYDATGDRMIVFASSTNSTAGEYGVMTWALTLTDPPTWSQLAPTGHVPSNRLGYTTVADPARGRILLHGGAFNGPSNQTWAFYLDETTPVAIALVSAEAMIDRVQLRWHVPGDRRFRATLERRVEDGPWTSSATLVPDGAGVLVHEDLDVRPGQRLAYRLAVMEDGVERHYGEVSLTIPTGNALRLHGARPNPVAGELKVAFELAGSAPARIELLDLAGRRLLDRDIGGLVAGEHVLEMNPGHRRIVAGLYFLRLSQGGRVLTRRVVVTP